MKSIRLLTSVVGAVEYAAGWEGEVPDHIADDLIHAGHAVPSSHSPAEATAKTAKPPHEKAEKATSPAAKTSEKR